MGLFRKSSRYHHTIYFAVPYMSARTGNIIGGGEFAAWVEYLIKTNLDIVHSVMQDFQMVKGDDAMDVDIGGHATITYETRD